MQKKKRKGKENKKPNTFTEINPTSKVIKTAAMILQASSDGTGLCLPARATVQELFSVARDAGAVPDISLDPVLVAFLSLDSRASLLHQYVSVQRGMTAEQLAAFRRNVTGELAGNPRVRLGGVGIVALALSVLFDLVARQVRGLQVSPPGAEEIFGIRRSSRIGWIIHSFLQQVPAIANDALKMAEATELYDNWLKLELIDHYERMTKKKRMSSESMRQWLAGSAVHLHMRIHQVRLNSVPPGSAESLRLSYKTGFSHLVQGYASYLRKNIRETPPSHTYGPIAQPGGLMPAQRSDLTNMTKEPCKTKVAGFPVHLGNVSQRNRTTRNHSTTRVATFNRGLANTSIVGSGSEDAASAGLLVIEPMRNVSHQVQHHPCESPAIEQALAVRVLAAQELEESREFFLYSQKVFDYLLGQRSHFDLRIRWREKT